MNKNSTAYTVVFAAVVCLVCGVAVASAAVVLREQQEINKVIDKKSKVLSASGLLPEGKVTAEEVSRLYDENVTPKVYDLKTGQLAAGVDAATFDQKQAMKDVETSVSAPPNPAQVMRIPHQALVYEIGKGGKTDSLVLPVEGKGLWSTLYGFLALSVDTSTIQGLIFYQHGETPGLGGEVDNPRWQQLWADRKPFNDKYEPVIAVIKGQAGTSQDDPHHVDGLSGATITSRGVTDLLQFWLGKHGYGPTLETYRKRHQGTDTATVEHGNEPGAPPRAHGR